MLPSGGLPNNALPRSILIPFLACEEHDLNMTGQGSGFTEP